MWSSDIEIMIYFLVYWSYCYVSSLRLSVCVFPIPVPACNFVFEPVSAAFLGILECLHVVRNAHQLVPPRNLLLNGNGASLKLPAGTKFSVCLPPLQNQPPQVFILLQMEFSRENNKGVSAPLHNWNLYTLILLSRCSCLGYFQ